MIAWLLDATREKALYDWAVLGLPATYSVIWADPKTAGHAATHPPFPYATLKIISVQAPPLGVGYRWYGHRIVVTAAGKQVAVTIDGTAYGINEGTTKTTAQLATLLAAKLNTDLPTKLAATASGAEVIVAPITETIFTLNATTNCSVIDRFLRKTCGAFMLSVNTYATDDGHHAAVKNLLYSARTAAAVKILRDQGISYNGGEGITDLTFLDETGFIRRAQVDILLTYGDAFIEEVPQIGKIIMTAEVDDENGDKIADISTTIDL